MTISRQLYDILKLPLSIVVLLSVFSFNLKAETVHPENGEVSYIIKLGDNINLSKLESSILNLNAELISDVIIIYSKDNRYVAYALLSSINTNIYDRLMGYKSKFQDAEVSNISVSSLLSNAVVRYSIVRSIYDPKIMDIQNISRSDLNVTGSFDTNKKNSNVAESSNKYKKDASDNNMTNLLNYYKTKNNQKEEVKDLPYYKALNDIPDTEETFSIKLDIGTNIDDLQEKVLRLKKELIQTVKIIQSDTRLYSAYALFYDNEEKLEAVSEEYKKTFLSAYVDKINVKEFKSKLVLDYGVVLLVDTKK